MTYRRRDDVVARSVAGENLLIPIQGCTDSVYTLNITGCHLWDLLAENQTEDTLAAALAQRYQITREAARTDVRLFLADMVRMQLVTTIDA